MKKLFYIVKSSASKLRELRAELDKKIENKYGFHYSDYDLDSIIDVLDYGTGEMTYEEFVDTMQRERIKIAQREKDTP